MASASWLETVVTRSRWLLLNAPAADLLHSRIKPISAESFVMGETSSDFAPSKILSPSGLMLSGEARSVPVAFCFNKTARGLAGETSLASGGARPDQIRR